MHHMMRKPNTAKPARQPAIPPTTAAVLTVPEELAVEEGVADAMVPVLITILDCDVNVEVECEVTATTGVYQMINNLYVYKRSDTDRGYHSLWD
jgi:hypothetical protein